MLYLFKIHLLAVMNTRFLTVMNTRLLTKTLYLVKLTLFLLGLYSPEVHSQIIPDHYLINNSSANVNQGRIIIEGGTRQGNNLFHSFQEFNLNKGESVYFNNSLNINNIITRVTGNNVSYINGLIQSNGLANFFFINPNGIIFGSNATLRIGGSFIASTANSLKFSDGIEYSAVAPDKNSLLSVNVPLGLQLGQNPGSINVQGLGHNFISKSLLTLRNFNSEGLNIKPNNSISLIGGNIYLKGGIIRSNGGNIYLGSFQNTTVLFDANFGAIKPNNPLNFQNIVLTERAVLDSSGLNAGTIKLQSKDIYIDQGSIIFNQSLLNSSRGFIYLDATESININGTDPIALIQGGIRTEALSQGQGSNIYINASNLSLQQGGIIQTISYSANKAGDILINLNNSLEILGISPRDNRAASNISSLAFLDGDAGKITIFTNSLEAQNGGGILSGTVGNGNSGDIYIEANNFVKVSGVDFNILIPSGISSSTIGRGNSSNLIIKTGRMLVEKGGQINSSTFGKGQAGNVIINVSDTLEIRDKVPGSINPSLIGSSASLVDSILGENFDFPDLSYLTGNSGSINISASNLRVLNGAKISVQNQGYGNAGNISINAKFIELNQNSQITASTQSGKGGNININASSYIGLQGSKIITTAIGGNGGNISITAGKFIVGDANSFITADALGGDGGNINLTAQGIFFPIANITASSDQGLDGEIEFNTQINEIEFKADETLPITTNSLIARSCLSPDKHYQSSQLAILGQGGLAITPDSSIDGFDFGQEMTQQEEIIEATGWIRLEDGRIALTSDKTQAGALPMIVCQ